MSDTNDQGVSLNRVAEIVSAFISNNSVSNKQIPDLITSVHQTLMKGTG
jgi:predicted transcriptional regulator